MLVESLSVIALGVVLVCAVVRPFRLPEAVFALPAAGVVVASRAVPLEHVREEVARLGPVVGFLAAVLVLAKLCADEGLFSACGTWMARRAAGRPRRLLGSVFVLASLITAALSLDATVVLLTPVVFATAARMGVRPKPHVYAAAHLSNTASLLLPVSNLTNLLAFTATGLTFTRFAALMALPWLVAILIEYAVLRRFFASDLEADLEADSGTDYGSDPENDPESGRGSDPGSGPESGRGGEGAAPAAAPEMPLFALVTVAATLLGFAVASLVGADPAWVAGAGALVMAIRALARRRTAPAAVLRAASVPFLVFVLALGVVVRAVVDNGLGRALGRVLPDGASLPALLGAAAVAAVLANVINNLPAVLALVPLVAPAGPGAVLAVLIGVNVGPNLTYAGSLATLLWRRVARQHDHEIWLGEFTRLGLLTTPAVLLASTTALWASLHLIGP